MKGNGFTLMELMLTVIVIAILVSLAVPNYISTVERTRAREAKATLESMRAAQLTYDAERRTFIQLTVANDSNWLAVGLENPNDNDQRSWNFTFDDTTGAGTATRRSGMNSGETIVLQPDGAFDESGWTP